MAEFIWSAFWFAVVIWIAIKVDRKFRGKGKGKEIRKID